MNENNCFLGNCPPDLVEREVDRIKLSEGSGGQEMHRLIAWMKKKLHTPSSWQNMDNDSSTLLFPSKPNALNHVVFTTDSYVVSPLFFPGGNIGTIAFCGTINDLAVMGAEPLGISLGLVLEEGLPREVLEKIIDTMGDLSKKYTIPIVTGDTKVMERRAVDKIIVNTSGVGHTSRILNTPLHEGDAIIVSGGVGEHGATLLAKRFDLETELQTDAQSILPEMRAVRDYVKQARDVTRGGLMSVIHEVAQKNKVGAHLLEEKIPIRKEVRSITELLGIDPLSLACEGRMVCFCSLENAPRVVSALQSFNPTAGMIGTITRESGVTLQTIFGKKTIPVPSGVLTPRIC
jgi:hydrogenase expression/formation protein HypE